MTFERCSSVFKRLAYGTVGGPLLVGGAGLCQGIFYLLDYRYHHRNAPEPLSPASGVVMVNTVGQEREEEVSKKKALKLLVVGDSLAVGVGTSSSSHPILPQSISKALSKALHGQPVKWTCIGTSGATANRIVADIEMYHQNHHDKTHLHQAPHQLDTAATDTNNNDDNNNPFNKISFRVKQFIRNKIKREECQNEQLKQIDGYDIAVVLTGLNDVKEAVLPFLAAQPSPQQKQNDDNDTSSGYQAKLDNILAALKDKMANVTTDAQKIPTLKQQQEDTQQKQPPSKLKSPIIVLPGLPAEIVPAFQSRPLRWFALPLIHQVDHHKQIISSLHPHSVLFIPSPPISQVQDYEAGLGPITTQRASEKIILLIQDASQRVQEKIQEAMDLYYVLKQQQRTSEETEEKKEREYEQSYHENSSALQPISYHAAPGAKLFSIDNVHPNDDGYDFYGRYIAAQILEKWDR